MVFRNWQEAGGLVLACSLLAACGDDGPSAETDTEADTTGSPTSSPTSSPSTSSTSTDPSTTSTGPDTTGEASDDTMTPTGESTDATTSDGTTTTMGTTEATTTDTTGDESTGSTTAADCMDGDDDADGICNAEDLCDDMLATHCLELGMNGSAVFENYAISTGVFDDLLDQDIVVGVSLDVASIAEPAACDSVDTIAKQYDATVVAINMVSSDAAANAYLQDEVLAELALEGVNDAIRFVGQGMNTPIFQAQFTAGMPPGHRFSLGDNASYMPDCDSVDIDSTITGSTALFQLDFVDMMGAMTDRIQGLGAEYTLYPVGE